jgi:hypothetical protein
LNLVFEVPDSDDDLEGLKSAAERLDAAIEQMGKNPSLGRFGPLGKEPTGLVPTTHEAIHNHSRRQLHPRWVWITKNSMVDWDGRLGFLATRKELWKFRDKVRKVFLRQLPSALQVSFTQVVQMGREDERPAKRPWFHRGEADKEFHQERSLEDRDQGAKRQQAPGV